TDSDRERAKLSPDRLDAMVWAMTELMVDSVAQAWVDHYGAMAAAHLDHFCCLAANERVLQSRGLTTRRTCSDPYPNRASRSRPALRGHGETHGVVDAHASQLARYRSS